MRRLATLSVVLVSCAAPLIVIKATELIASHRSLHFQPHHLHVVASVFIWGASLNVRIGDLFYKILAQRFWKAPRVWEEDGAYPALERLFPAVHHVLRDQFNTFW